MKSSGRRLAIGLVLGVNLLAKDRLVPAVDHHRQVIRLALLDQVQQHLGEDKRRLGRLAGGLVRSRKGAK